MCDLQQWISQYLLDCQYQKGLDPKTIKAYRIDLAQFLELAGQKNFKFTRNEIMAYISRLHQQYKPKTIRRKIASIKAFFGYLEYEGLVQENPFSKLRIKLAIPVILPRTIPLSVISSILASAYQQKETARSQIQRDGTLRDIAVLELLFATGVRVSELCTLGYDDVRLEEGEIKIYGKGAKERFVQIANPNVVHVVLTSFLINCALSTFDPFIQLGTLKFPQLSNLVCWDHFFFYPVTNRNCLYA